MEFRDNIRGFLKSQYNALGVIKRRNEEQHVSKLFLYANIQGGLLWKTKVCSYLPKLHLGVTPLSPLG